MRNPERAREYYRLWLARNREKKNKYLREYYQRTRDKQLAAMRERDGRPKSPEAKEAKRVRSRDYYQRNKERLDAKRREWQRSPAGRASARRHYQRHREAFLKRAKRLRAANWERYRGYERRAKQVRKGLGRVLKLLYLLEALMTTKTKATAAANGKPPKGGSDDRLYDRLAAIGGQLLSRLKEGGSIVAALTDRGHDIGTIAKAMHTRDCRWISRPLLRLLLQVGRGEVLPEFVLRFCNRSVVFAKGKFLPIDEQRRMLKASDTEVEESFRRKPKSTGHFAPSGIHPGGSGRLPTLASMTRAATVKDAAEMCLEIVNANAEPQKVARILLELLEPIANKKGAAKP